MGLAQMKRKLQGYSGVNECHERTDLRSMSAYGSSWTSTRFSDVLMNAADLSRSTFVNCTFARCTGVLSHFTQANLESVVFLDCDLEQANFAGTILRNVSFVDCRMTYSTFNGATLRDGVRFDGCNLHGADLDFIEAKSPKFQNSNLWGAKVAIGCSFFNGEFDEKTCDRFLAMIARIHPDLPKRTVLKDMAGRQFGVVDREMAPERRIDNGREDERKSA